jgi:hypothetical protein
VTLCWADALGTQGGGGGEVVALRRQKQVRKLKDAWPIECFVSISISSLLS